MLIQIQCSSNRYRVLRAYSFCTASGPRILCISSEQQCYSTQFCLQRMQCLLNARAPTVRRDLGLLSCWNWETSSCFGGYRISTLPTVCRSPRRWRSPCSPRTETTPTMSSCCKKLKTSSLQSSKIEQSS